MTDNITVKDSSAADKIMAADEVGGVLHQIVKIGVGGDGLSSPMASNTGTVDASTPRFTQATDDVLPTLAVAAAATCTTTITRVSDTTAYTAGDSWSDSASAANQIILTGASRGSGKSGVITDVVVTNAVLGSPPLQGEIWVFDSQPTALLDNAPWALADVDLGKLVGVIPFTLASTGSSNGSSYDQIEGVNMGFTTVSDANLYLLIKVGNAYTPTSSEVLRIRAKILRSN